MCACVRARACVYLEPKGRRKLHVWSEARLKAVAYTKG